VVEEFCRREKLDAPPGERATEGLVLQEFLIAGDESAFRSCGSVGGLMCWDLITF
jgi:hypothetical protein